MKWQQFFEMQDGGDRYVLQWFRSVSTVVSSSFDAEVSYSAFVHFQLMAAMFDLSASYALHRIHNGLIVLLDH